jgi:hypothetical protein
MLRSELRETKGSSVVQIFMSPGTTGLGKTILATFLWNVMKHTGGLFATI